MSTVIEPQLVVKPVTAEEVFRMNHGNRHYELIAGVPRKMSPAGFHHGAVIGLLHGWLFDHVKRHRLGIVLGAETGFILSRDPDTVRGPDVGFVSRERIERIGIPQQFFPEAPDLAVEVLSPRDRVSEVEAKTEDWLNGGTRLLWIVSPRRRTITVHRSLTDIVVLTEDDTLDGGDVIPGFTCRVGDLFQPFFTGNPPN